MKKVFIDAGAYNGDTLREFFGWRQLLGDPNEFEIYAFEPNPNMQKALEDIASQHKNIEYIPKAVWVADEPIQFAVDTTETPLGSTVMPGKTNIWDNFGHVEVQGFDFSEWLKQFIDDEVIIKMDIEGAEFPVLEKMIIDKTIFIPKKLMVEFHPNKVREYTTEYCNDFIKQIKDMGVGLEVWH